MGGAGDGGVGYRPGGDPGDTGGGGGGGEVRETKEAAPRVPVGDMTNAQVRERARELSLHVEGVKVKMLRSAIQRKEAQLERQEATRRQEAAQRVARQAARGKGASLFLRSILARHRRRGLARAWARWAAALRCARMMQLLRLAAGHAAADQAESEALMEDLAVVGVDVAQAARLRAMFRQIDRGCTGALPTSALRDLLDAASDASATAAGDDFAMTLLLDLVVEALCGTDREDDRGRVRSERQWVEGVGGVVNGMDAEQIDELLNILALGAAAAAAALASPTAPLRRKRVRSDSGGSARLEARNVAAWGPREVCAWLAAVGEELEVYCPLFEEEGIDGALLLQARRARAPRAGCPHAVVSA